MRVIIFCIVIVFSFLATDICQAQQQEQPEYVGEFFGMPVSKQNYFFIKSIIAVFGNRWGKQPGTADEIEDVTWEELLLSYEAFRRNIVATQEEVDSEIDKMLKDEKAAFNWKKDKDAYAKWVKDKAGEPVELFGNQIRQLIEINKLREQVRSGFEPQVTDEEAHQVYLNQYNSISLEIIEFAEKKEAEDFYRKAKKDRAPWEAEKKKRPDSVRQPGFVTLEFLIEIWGVPKAALYKMLKMELKDIYPPEPIYKGFGVFMILEKRLADELEYPKRKYYYFDLIKERKRNGVLAGWLKDLKEKAKIKIYKKGG